MRNEPLFTTVVEPVVAYFEFSRSIHSQVSNSFFFWMKFLSGLLVVVYANYFYDEKYGATTLSTTTLGITTCSITIN